jgi:hypothetical protein
MKELINKFFLKTKREGIFSALQTLWNWLSEKRTNAYYVYQRKKILSKQIDEQFKSTVKYGPFKGLRMATDSWWSYADRAAILFGLYEQEVLLSLKNVPPNYKTFIDIGAADGYYGVGVLINDMFDKSYCYETSEKGRDVIKQNAALNNVADRIEIRRKAEKTFYKDFTPDELKRSVILVDIEGGEFDLLDQTTLKALMRSIIIVELHDWRFEDGQSKLQRLINDAKATHKVSKFTTSSRDLSGFEELKQYADTDRWLICSERRDRLMTWLRLDPL